MNSDPQLRPSSSLYFALIAPGSIPRSLLRTFNFEIWKLKCLGACPEDLYFEIFWIATPASRDRNDRETLRCEDGERYAAQLRSERPMAASVVNFGGAEVRVNYVAGIGQRAVPLSPDQSRLIHGEWEVRKVSGHCGS